jgi:hypothetical protein
LLHCPRAGVYPAQATQVRGAGGQGRAAGAVAGYTGAAGGVGGIKHNGSEMKKLRTARCMEREAEEMWERVADYVREHGYEELTLVVRDQEGGEWLFRINENGGVYPVEQVHRAPEARQ